MMSCVIRIKESLPILTETDTMIGNYILEHQSEVLSASTQTLATLTKTSPSAIIRFSKKIGFTGFPQLKIELAKDVSNELSEFDAWVEYSIVLDALDGDSEQEYRLGNVYLSTENVMRLEQLADIKSKASNGVFISIVLLVACFVVIRRRRLYECVVWGGAAGVIIGIISFIAMAVSGSGIMYGIRRMVFGESYAELFPGHDVLPDIIPAGTGTKVLWVYVGTIFVGLVVTIIVRVISYKKSRPHKFR